MKNFHSFFYATLVVLGLASCNSGSGSLPETVALKNATDSVSYGLGVNMAQNLKRSGLDTLNPLVVAQAMQAIYAGKEPILNEEGVRAALNRFQALQQEKMQKQGVENLAKAQKFMEENKSKDGIKEHPIGVQYKILTEGTGEVIGEEDGVTVHYTGKLIDGKKFDSSLDRQQPFTVDNFGGVIKGWSALKGMKVGTKCELYIPPALGYGEQGGGSIPPNSVLVFEIEILAKAKGQSSADPLSGQGGQQ